MLSRSNTTLVTRFDCPGGGQVWIEGTTMYVGHQRPTSGTTIVDVADPSNPKLLARIDVPEGWHSHKVRVSGDIMVVNHEKFGKAASPGFDPDLHLQRIGLANQTTMLMSESLQVQELFRQAMHDRLGEVGMSERFRAFDTICSATQDRQDAVVNLLTDTSLGH